VYVLAPFCVVYYVCYLCFSHRAACPLEHQYTHFEYMQCVREKIRGLTGRRCVRPSRFSVTTVVCVIGVLMRAMYKHARLLLALLFISHVALTSLCFIWSVIRFLCYV
jgi:hypothetical protein